MIVLSYANRAAAPVRVAPRWAGPTWLRTFLQLWKPEKKRAAPVEHETQNQDDKRTPVFAISQLREDRWMVSRPEGIMEHAFNSLDAAVAFVRHEAVDRSATVELRIGDLYVVANYDPREPGSLFGERV